MRDEELAGDVAGADAQESQLNDPPANVIRKGATVHKHSTQLVHPGLTFLKTNVNKLIKNHVIPCSGFIIPMYK